MWLTDERVPSGYVVWAELAANFDETGLWPVVWSAPIPPQVDRPVHPPQNRDAEALLASLWDEFVGWMEEDAAPFVAPFGETFPGLAPAQTECQYNAVDRFRSDDRFRDDKIGDRLALVAVERPADIPATIGWNDTTDLEYAEEISVVLRSWEDRFGAYLVSLSPGYMDLTIERPPETEQDHWLWAAERLAFNQNHVQSESLAEYVELSVKSDHTVAFWWD